MNLAELVTVSGRVAQTRKRREKTALLGSYLRSLASHPESAFFVRVATSYLAGILPQGKIGVGHSVLHGLQHVAAADHSLLSLREVDRAFQSVYEEKGAGQAARRNATLSSLLTRATADEQSFLFRLLAGELRQGALEPLVIEAVAAAFDASLTDVRRAAMFAGGVPDVATALAVAGTAGLAQFDLRMFSAVQPMLADSAADTDEALQALGQAALEYKLDGARMQIHKDGSRVEIFSRALNRVTESVPEIVEAVQALPARQLVLDGEALAFSPQGRPLPFQVTMKRFGRKLDVESQRAQLPLSMRLFDVLRVDDRTTIDETLTNRWSILNEATAGAHLVPRLVTASVDDADAFLANAMAEGHEGIMAKSLAAPYNAGRRGQSWLKLKPTHTLDLVVLAIEWGSGRRQGWLSNIHLGARDPVHGGFVMLGKTFKGMTDETLRWQTEIFAKIELGREGGIVHVRPEVVAEIAFNDVQTSDYPGGMALRFARLKRYRPDKRAEEANTIDDVRALLPKH